MVGTTLVELRAHVEALASSGGTYAVVCGRTGERPIPAAGKRFPDRPTAGRAVRATARYRRALRRYDPQLPYYDLIVCEETGPLVPCETPNQRPNQRPDPGAGPWTLSAPVLDGPDQPERSDRIEFCHRVAAAVFETLSDGPYDGVETAVMDAYFDLAESVADPDDLCLCLLESVATEIDARLAPHRQAAVLADATAGLVPAAPSSEPVASALTVLQRRGLVGAFTCAPAAVDRSSRARSVAVTLSEYALSPREGELPVLPLAVELYRHRPAWSPTAIRVVDADSDSDADADADAGDREEEWRLTVELGADADPDGLSSAPVRERA